MRITLFLSVLVLSVAALVYVVRYVLLVINRNTLLNSMRGHRRGLARGTGQRGGDRGGDRLRRDADPVADRAQAPPRSRIYGLPEPRSVRALWAGCLVPLANLLWAPVYVIELATVEEHYARLRRPIVQWWIAWVFSYLVSIFAIATSFARDAQGIANNTVLMVFAYLFAAATLAAAARVFEGFERKPVERPAHRWVVVDAGSARPPPRPHRAAPVELEGQEPAA